MSEKFPVYVIIFALIIVALLLCIVVDVGTTSESWENATIVGIDKHGNWYMYTFQFDKDIRMRFNSVNYYEFNSSIQAYTVRGGLFKMPINIVDVKV